MLLNYPKPKEDSNLRLFNVLSQSFKILYFVISLFGKYAESGSFLWLFNEEDANIISIIIIGQI
jgi:hypothetical protein